VRHNSTADDRHRDTADALLNHTRQMILALSISTCVVFVIGCFLSFAAGIFTFALLSANHR
jgi:Sec-independent protein secretion pathway component TatC